MFLLIAYVLGVVSGVVVSVIMRVREKEKQISLELKDKEYTYHCFESWRGPDSHTLPEEE
jgi:hypothetical protein